MKNRILLLVAVLLVAICVSTVRAQNLEGQILAVQYGLWRVQGIPQPATGNSFNFVAAACDQIAGNKTFQPFKVGTPIEIFDANPALNETVTPTAVSATNQGCSITVAPAQTHNSFSLGSATAGLQEALNANITNPTVNTVVLTAEWYRHGGSSGTITSVQGSTALNLVDVTKAPYDWYTWNGSVYVKVPLGGANLPHVTQIISGDGLGNGVGMPEKGTTVAGGVATVAWNEDKGLGLFDCRDTKYSGGCLGTTPGLAMQALANDITCYQAITGLRANVIFPPGTISIGTAANPTLVFPTGAHYASSAPNPNGTATIFQATYNGHLALHFMTAVSATCSDGNVHTNALTNGYYGGGISVHGCAQGGCVNVPGDTNGYPNGGQNQVGILAEDSGGQVDFIGAYENGGEGINIAGESTHVGTVWTASNMAWYYFGIGASGVTYNPTTDGWHCNIELNSLDGTFPGPFETGGFLQTPGAEYGHVCGVFWGGGNSQMGPMFSNRDEVGLVRASGNTSGRVLGGRIDGPMGEGIVVQNGGNSFTAIDNSSACSGFSTVAKGTVFGPWIANLGAGMTTGTYVVPGVNQAGDTTGSGATLTVTVSGGIATGITVSNHGSLYLATPTFTMTGTGGTPATIGATTYQHCDKLDDGVGQNSYSAVRNIFESFFGTDHSTGDIWQLVGSVFDRATTGNFERVTGIVNEPKGQGAHRDLLDPAQTHGGVGITGPALDFSNGNHFAAADTTPTSWTGPFTVASIMQDLWIWGGNANTTLPVSAGWQTCSGHDLNLVSPQWYHFFVFQDDVFFTVGTNFIFKEQCDTIFEDYMQPGFAVFGGSLPTTDTLATMDVAGTYAVRPYPALGALTLTSAGATSSFTYCFVIQVWVAGGKQTTASVCGTKTPPVTTGGLDNLFVNLTLPQNWLRYKVYLNSTTDGSFTPGVWYDTTTPNGLPQPSSSLRLPITVFTPTDTSTISTANLSLNMTGTFNASIGGVPVPASSNTLCIPGQEIHSCSAGFDYTCTSEDHWVRNPITCSTF